MVAFIEPHTLLEGKGTTDDELVQPRPDTPMKKFYRGTNVFITGGTGFMGKVLTEKLLRCFPDLDNIYLMIREKKGVNIESRMDAIYEQNPLFYALQRAQPKFRHKITAIAGDCALPGLGLSIEDRDLLLRQVDVVFHVAATVKFDERLRLAVGINVTGTRDVLQLAKQMQRLKAIVHVSTAYCNCHLPEINEKFYEPPMPYQSLVNMVDACTDKILDGVTPIVLDAWPNTYAMTKAVAEDIIRQEGPGLPILVFRPAIVVGISNDPLPGWIDNLYGPTGVLVGAGTGVLKTMHADPEAIANIVPVDMAVNAMIAAAWDVGCRERAVTAADIPIYNYVSSCEQPLIWNDFISLTEKHGMVVPSLRAIWYYSFTVNKYFWVHWVYSMCLHFLPALFVDALASAQGKRPKLWNIYKKIDKFTDVISYFSTRTWRFSNGNVQALWLKLCDEDQRIFLFDMKKLDWGDFFHTYIRGCRVFLAKDDMSTVPQALIRWRRLYWLHQGVKTIGILVFLRIVWFFLATIYSFLSS